MATKREVSVKVGGLAWQRWLLAILVTVVALALAGRGVAWAEVWAVVKTAEPGWLALTLGVVVLNIAAKAARWQALLATLPPPPRPGRTLGALLVGQMWNWVSPVRVGDVARVWLVQPVRSGWLPVAATVALEKACDLLWYAAICLGLLLAMPLPGWFTNPTAFLGLALALGGVGVWIVARRWRWLERWLVAHAPRWAVRRWQALAPGLALLVGVQRRAVLVRVMGWSAVVWATAILTNYLVLRAVGIDVPWLAAVLVLAVLQAGITLPSLPATLGLFQALCVAALGLWAVPAATAIGYGLILQAVVMLPPLIGGIAAWLILAPAKGTSP